MNTSPGHHAQHDPLAAEIALQEPSLLRRLWPLAVLLLVAALIWVFRARIPFHPHAFAQQLRQLAPVHVLLALLAIYVGFILRGTRWAILLAPVRAAGTRELLPSQFIGFTAVALFGRVADLARPYLVAQRLRTPVAMQLGVYSIERAFDLAAAAILFSVTLAFAPRGMPHHEAFTRAGTASLLATLFLVVVALLIRFRGEQLAAASDRLLAPRFPRLAVAIATRVRELRQGFGTITSGGQFAAALAVSLIMWIGIALCYLQSARAFQHEPTLAQMSFTGVMLLMATSLGASLLQLPILGWFTQIAATAAAYHAFYGVPLESASACGALSLFTTSLSVIPAGLVAARLGGIRLRDAGRTVADAVEA